MILSAQAAKQSVPPAQLIIEVGNLAGGQFGPSTSGTAANINFQLQSHISMRKNWNSIWRYIHLTFGLILVVYHARIAWYHQGIVDSVWSADIDKLVSTTLIFFVMWTGLAKWPIYPWYKKRQNKKKRAQKAAAAE